MNRKRAFIPISLALLCLLSLLSNPAYADNVTLAWDANTDADLAGYKVYYGNSSGNYSQVVNVGKITVYTVTGLGPGNYYFAVTAYNKAGAESSFSNEVSKTIGSPTSQISSIGATSITNNSANVVWTTSSPANSQVEYGTTVSYGTASALNTALVTSHSQILSGLNPGTLYHFRVSSRDAAGNLAVSGDFTFVTAALKDTAPPVISAVLTSVAATGAVISWSTNEPADSQVEFGTSAAYGGSTALDINKVTSHFLTLNGLTANTEFHYRIKSRDSAGNLAVSQDYVFKTALSLSNTVRSLFYPVISPSFRSAMPQGDGEYTGIALSNLDLTPATIRFTAYEASGIVMRGSGILNPVERTLKRGGQMPVIDDQLFGAAIHNAGSLGWIQVDSSTTKLAGFFLTFSGSLSLMDGGRISPSLLRSFVLPEIWDQDFTMVLLANPNKDGALVTMDLVKSDGTIRSTAQRLIGGNAALSADLYANIFPRSTPVPSDYLRVTSNQALLPFESSGMADSDIAVLEGLDRGGGATTLYSPQYVAGGAWRTTLSIINLDANPGVVTLKLIGDDGIQVGPARLVNVAGGGKVYVSDQAFFGPAVMTNPDRLVQGYVEVTGSGIHMTGSVVFSNAARRTFSSALPLVSTLEKSIIFSHIASNDIYFTGAAILNPNDTAVTATIDLYDSEGVLQGSSAQAIPAGQRVSRLLTEYFPALVGQNKTSGYFRVTVDKAVACYALFGTNDLSVLSAIPAQPVP